MNIKHDNIPEVEIKWYSLIMIIDKHQVRITNKIIIVATNSNRLCPCPVRNTPVTVYHFMYDIV